MSRKLVVLFLVFLTFVMLATTFSLSEDIGLELEGWNRIEVAVKNILP